MASVQKVKFKNMTCVGKGILCQVEIIKSSLTGV